MTTNYRFQKIIRSRIATFDIFDVGMRKHHISAMLEFDVTESRAKLRELRKKGINVSFNAWLLKIIGSVLEQHPEAAAYFYNKKKLIIFDDINISMIIEKLIGDVKVPMPLVIEKVNKKMALEITKEIEKAKGLELNPDDIVLEKQSAAYQRLYYHMPGKLRRLFWKILLKSLGI